MACAQTAVHYGTEKIDALRPGITTQQELIHAFGMPTYVATRQDESVLYTWQRLPGSPLNEIDVEVLSILIDSGGKMNRIVRVVR